jgi:hypothetical protein
MVLGRRRHNVGHLLGNCIAPALVDGQPSYFAGVSFSKLTPAATTLRKNEVEDSAKRKLRLSG